jgi:dihydropyrimidinase
MGVTTGYRYLTPASRRNWPQRTFISLITDYSIWDGFDIEGWPATTILRGSVVVDNGQLNATLGGGQFIRRKVDAEVTNWPVC